MILQERHIVLVGSGRVANFFGHALKARGHAIDAVISRNSEKGAQLAASLGSRQQSDYQIPAQTELVLLAVKDDAIEEVQAALPQTEALVCHTAGAVSLDVLNRFKHAGVLYPYQSIQQGIRVQEVPLLLESRTENGLEILKDLFEGLGFRCHAVDSARRLWYHLTAVFANNFSNAVLAGAEKLIQQENLDFELLKPILQHTFENALEAKAGERQTGPALRNDQATMDKHLSLLAKRPEMQELYKAVSKFIFQQKP